MQHPHCITLWRFCLTSTGRIPTVQCPTCHTRPFGNNTRAIHLNPIRETWPINPLSMDHELRPPPARLLLAPRVRASRAARVAWAGAALACAAILSVAIYLEPDPRGFGTHQRFGAALPPCSFMQTSGLPCPTCGMTTAFSSVVRGRLASAFIAQPAGFVFCLATISIFLFSLYVSISGWTIWINWDRISTRLMLGLGLIIVAGWGFKIAYGLLTGTLPAR